MVARRRIHIDNNLMRKERRPSGARERCGRKMLERPGEMTERRGDPCGRPISANVPIYREAQVRQDSESRWRRRTPSELIHI